MEPDVQRNKTVQEDPTPPPVDYSPQLSLPRVSWQGTHSLLRILGVAMALGGGIAAGYVFPTMEIRSALVGWLALLAVVLWGALAGFVLRSWWAILIIPAVFSVSVFLGTIIQGGGFDLQTWLASAPFAIAIVAIFGVLPLLVGVVIGTSLGMRLERRPRR